MSLELRFDPPGTSGRAQAAWRDALARDLGDEGLRVVEPGTPGAVEVRIRVTVETATGRTGVGTEFRVARSRATIDVLRASVEILGRTCVATADARADELADDLADELATRSLESLLPQAVAALTW